jgi:hypothetical protein
MKAAGRMRNATRLKSASRAPLAFLAIALSPASLYARSCPMCYQAAANSSSQFFEALKHGIIFMMLGPLVITGAIVYIAYQKRNQFSKEAAPSRVEYYDVTRNLEFSD